jgi:D-alanyl-D-alanine carboxypeptidase
MNKKILILLLFTFCLGFNVRAQKVNSAKLDSLLDLLAANNKTMGSLAISQNGKIVYQKAVGFAVAGHAPIVAGIKTKYRIGSITKMFTGVMAMQLVEEGKLTLETTLDKFYPQMPNAAKITMAMLLSHHSGLFNITNSPGFAAYMTTHQSHEQLVTKMVALTPAFEPGAKYEYSNTNFILLAYIIEKITGNTYPEEVEKRIITKIGLKDTYYGAKINPAINEALPYSFYELWKELPQTDMSIPSGAGAMVSTPADLCKFAEALYNGKLVSKATLQQMLPAKENYGLAMHKIDFEDKTGYGHGGAIDGFRTTLTYFPQENLAVAYTANGTSYSPEKLVQNALSIYFNRPFTLPVFAKPLAITSADLDKYLGVYASPGFPLKITVIKNGATLYGQATGQGPLKLETTQKDIFTHEPAGIVMEFAPEKNQFTLKQGGRVTVFTQE